MKKIIIALSISLMGGCVDTGRVGLHPTTKTAYFDGHPFQVESCLSVAAQDQRLYLEQDEPLPDGTKRYNLEQDNETVAWVEIAKFSPHQTSATFTMIQSIRYQHSSFRDDRAVQNITLNAASACA